MTTYETEQARQKSRRDIPTGHLPVHRWYLRMEQPWQVELLDAPRDGISIVRAEKPTIAFYRFLYHTAGEEFLWGDRRRLSDDDLAELIGSPDVHLMVLYDHGTPAGFFELNFTKRDQSEIKYFALLPGFIGRGLGSYMLNQAIVMGGVPKLPLIVDTCTLDHSSALENYKKRGFEIYAEEDEVYPDPRLDGTLPPHVGSHVPPAAV